MHGDQTLSSSLPFLRFTCSSLGLLFPDRGVHIAKQFDLPRPRRDPHEIGPGLDVLQRNRVRPPISERSTGGELLEPLPKIGERRRRLAYNLKMVLGDAGLSSVGD
jgi:hypothetical protein